MRLFLGVQPDAGCRAEMARQLADARAASAGIDKSFRWTPVDNLHVTLHFLGSVDSARCAPLLEELSAPLALEPFEAITGVWGRFPSRGAPNVLWIGVDRGAADLTQVYGLVSQRLRSLSLAVESRPFTPHITVARVRDRDRQTARRMLWPPAAPHPSIAFPVDRVTLFESDLSGAEPRYTPRIQIGFGR